MKKISLIILLLAFLSCDKKEINKEESNSQVEINLKDTLDVKLKSIDNSKANNDWKNVLIIDYIKNSKKELIQSALKNNKDVQWLFDQMEKNDSTQFYIYNIGIHVSEEDGSEPRFSSCGWVYLDSVKRKLYEYDLPNDTIVEWKK